ncbi:uncharacterized mitochondrial protein AtMg00810-like [Carya illinoinensis]|uniref:uncharacterized mitochondrial protein AtMg00810-like n=1 Tax=Carya illinoinensis TaxID=32201 RepID=UPI001C719E28|nr:uncharacterized mitochondrial protein AtMg00810-like [Carya illinoinensis]
MVEAMAEDMNVPLLEEDHLVVKYVARRGISQTVASNAKSAMVQPQKLSNNSSFLDNFTRKLNSEFATKDLGSLSYFLSLEATSTTDDPTLHRSLVGALQYLTITHHDIAHAVNSVSQFLHSPIEAHFQAIKRILLYAGCPYPRRSTSGYSIYLGGNLVSWSAKKQPTVSRSNYESEYRALALAAFEIL